MTRQPPRTSPTKTALRNARKLVEAAGTFIR